MNSVLNGQRTNVLLPQGNILKLKTDANSAGIAYLCTDASGTNTTVSYPFPNSQNTFNIGAFGEDTNVLIVCTAGLVEYSISLAPSAVTSGQTPSAGQVGEQLTVTTSATSLTTGVSAVGAALALTPGIWQLTASVSLTLGDNTVLSSVQAGFSDTTTMPVEPDYALVSGVTCNGAGISGGQSAGPAFVVPAALRNTTSAPTINLIVNATFITDVCTVTAKITATRIE